MAFGTEGGSAGCRWHAGTAAARGWLMPHNGGGGDIRQQGDCRPGL
ncbi:MAG: hypothetical protein IIU87_09200 [Prevotella sp.]|nr:hypothetical protein [Prevotella sp.]